MQFWRGTSIPRSSLFLICMLIGVSMQTRTLYGQGNKPNPPTLNNASNITSSSADISWSVVTGATSYSYEVSKKSNFQDLVTSGSTTNTSVTITGLQSGTTYYYRVDVTVAGKTSNPSQDNFITLGSPPLPPDPPVLGVPTITASSASLQWSTAEGAVSYTIEIASDNKFTKSVGGGSTATQSFTVDNLTPSTQYYYRVKSVSAENLESAWVEGSFTTQAPAMATPIHTSPADGSTSVPVNVTLQWNSVAGATSYSIEVATSSNFSGASTHTSATPSLTLTSLQNNTMYYWRVNATDGSTTSGWSSAWKFTTALGLPAIPSPIEPSDGATGVSTSPTLKWGEVTGADTYDLQVSTKSDFSSVDVLDKQRLKSTSDNLSRLTENTTYYWRVRATNGAGSSNWSSTVSFKTQLSLPATPTILEPADGATEVSTSPTLKWNSAVGADTYDLQVSTKSNFSSVDVTDKQKLNTTSENLTQLTENTSYYWRVRATNTIGSSDWSSTASFKTQLALPATPTIVEPSNGATGISTSPTLKWNAVIGADTYDLQVSTKSDFSSIDVTDKPRLRSTSESLSRLTEGTSYHWRVRAVNATGSSNWTSATFTTQIAPPAKAPDLVSPTNKSVIVPPGTTLSWSSVNGATSYSVQMAEDSKFPQDQLFINETSLISTSQSHAVTGLKGEKTYYWRVSAENEGGSSGWSSANYFTTASTKPAAPTSPIPSSDVSGLPVSVTLAWSPNNDPSSVYEVQVATDDKFHTIVASNSSLTKSFWDVKLSYDQKYYWHVRVTTNGGTSDWSTTWNFSTETGKPARVSLMLPDSNATKVPINVSLEWGSAKGALSYRVQVATKENFNPLIMDTTGVIRTSFALSGLSNNTTYYWRVYGIGPNGEGPVSSEWSFTTVDAVIASPQLLLPTDNSRDASTPVLLSWSPVTGALRYQVQISTDRNFSTLAKDSTGLTNASCTIPGLLPEVTYYWRVRCFNAVGASNWSTDWSFKTKSAQLASPALIKPSDKSDNLELGPALEWALVPNADSYRVQLTKDLKFSLVVIDTIVKASTSLQLKGLEPNTQYYWRVLAASLTSISNWSTENSFKTGAAVLAKPKLLFPENNVRDVPLEVTFQWEVILKAKSYALQYSIDRDFKIGSTIEVQGIEKAQYSVIGLLPETKYYWRIQAKDTATLSGWTDAQSFTTGSGKIAAPNLIQPSNSAQGVSTSPTLNWTAVLRAKLYGVAIATDRNFKTIIYEKKDLTSTTHQVTGLISGTDYFWRVSASDSTGYTVWSSEWSFTTGSSLLSTPSLISPSNSAEGISINPKLEWSKIDGALSYELQVSTNKSFNTNVEQRQGILSTSASLSGLLFNQTYYWRVRATGTASSSEWSKEYEFTTGSSKLSIPVLLSPEDRATDISTEPRFEWTTVEGANTYVFQISLTQSFSTLLFTREIVSGNFTIVSGLKATTQYYWRILALSSTDTSDWSDVRRFTTWDDQLAAPSLVAPSDGATGQSITPTLAWTVSPRALTYTIQYSTSANFSDNLVEIKGVTKATHSLSELLPLTKYYWRVNALDTTHVSSWSQRWSFTTGSNRLAVPDLLTPLEGADLEAGKNPTLTWKSVPGATRYEVQVSPDKNFNPLLVNEQGVLATSLTISGLQEKTKYYWKVRSTNGAEWSDWSIVWSFSIRPQVTSVEEYPGIPRSLKLFQNYPNPFNPSTAISFDIPQETHARVAIYSIDGKRVATVVEGILQAGHYRFSWNVGILPSGVYFCRLESSGFSGSVRMLLLK
ncbi:MAG: fibronectin type III domain-containing protein [bacterium]